MQGISARVFLDRSRAPKPLQMKKSKNTNFPRKAHFWDEKTGNVLIFRFGNAFGARNAPERKSGPKSGKSDFGRFGLQKRAQMLMFSLFGARSEKHDFSSSFTHFCFFSLLGRKSSFWLPKVVKTGKNAKIPPFYVFVRKWLPK